MQNYHKRLNSFYARFEEYNTESCLKAPVVHDDSGISLSVADVNKILKQINTFKAARQDGIPDCPKL